MEPIITVKTNLDSVTVELVSSVEDGAAVRSVIVGYVQARRVRLGHKAASVAQAGEDPLQQPVVVHLLQADDVGLLPHHLLHHLPPAALPVQGVQGG